MSIKSLGFQSLIYGLGHVMARLITFLLLPLYTHTFSNEEYGALSLAYAFMGFALIFYRYGMDTALMKYSVQKSGVKRIKFITVIVMSQVVTGIIFTLTLILVRHDIAEYILGVAKPEWIIYLAGILFLDSIWNLPLLILRSEQKAIPFILFSIINVVATMFLNIVFVVHLNKGVEGVFIANILASFLLVLFTSPIFINRIKPYLFEKNIFSEILLFSLPFLPAGIFTMIMELSDRYILEWFLGTGSVGIYSAGKKMGMLGLTVVMGFNMGWTPYFLERGRQKGAKVEFSQITTIFLGIMGYISVLVCIWISEIIRFPIAGTTLIGSEFWHCEPVVNAILIGYFFFGTYVIQLPGVYIKEITNWVPVFRVSGVIALFISCFFLIPKFGFLGAAYSVIISFITMSLSIYFRTYKIYPIPYNYKGLMYPIIYLLIVQLSFESLFIKLFLSIFYPVMWYIFVINKTEKETIKELLK
tara:strand:+ start:1877 stop:3295 length:1419 start_codon:yes stop_codon:yes gene_type:complete